MKSVVEGMADRGINIVRVPISTELLLEWKAGEKIKVNINTNCNPELKNADGSDMDSRQVLGTNSFVDPVERLSLVVTIQNRPPFTRSVLTYGLRNPLYAALD